MIRALPLAIAVATIVEAQATLPPATGTPGVPGELRSVEGRVLRGGAGDLQPVAGQYVILHRISADAAGPVDSMRTASGGRYRFQYRLESTGAMYILSSRHDGVAYFSPPLRAQDVTGPDADLVVYDTTSVAFPLTIRSRHFVVSPPDGSGLRRVVDVFEVANDSTRTLVSGAGESGTWAARLPDGARDPQASGGDVPPEALRFGNGQVTMVAPFPPGARQVVLTYGIPPTAPVEVPVDAATALVEVLIEGAGGAVSGTSLSAEPTVTMEGRTFQRYVGGPVPAGASFTVRWSGGGLGGRAGRLALAGLAALALALGIVAGRRGRSAAPARPRAVTNAETLARAITALDRVYTDQAREDPAARAAWEARRAELKGRLVAVMAVEDEAAVK